MTIDSSAKGKRAERAVVNWLKANGFPDARRTKAGQRNDPGDIEPCGPIYPPPILISVKAGYTKDPHPGTLQWQDWWYSLQKTVDDRNPDALGLLVHAREGKSSPDHWRWWVDCDCCGKGPVQITGTQALLLMKGRADG